MWQWIVTLLGILTIMVCTTICILCDMKSFHFGYTEYECHLFALTKQKENSDLPKNNFVNNGFLCVVPHIHDLELK